jgi:hypothetical protein
MLQLGRIPIHSSWTNNKAARIAEKCKLNHIPQLCLMHIKYGIVYINDEDILYRVSRKNAAAVDRFDKWLPLFFSREINSDWTYDAH